MNLVTFNEDLIKATFKKNTKVKKNIFLVENHKSKSYSINLDSEISTNKKKNYFNYICNLYEDILDDLVVSLNKLHKKNFKKKYWEFLLSRWLWTYIFYTYNAWELIRIAEKNKKFQSTKVLKLNPNFFIPNNTMHFHNMAMKSNYWSSWVFYEIAKSNKKKNLIFFKPKKKNIKKSLNLFDVKIPVYKSIKSFFNPKKFFFYKFQLPQKIKTKFFLKNYYFDFKKIKYLQIKKNKNKKKNLTREGFYKFKKTKDSFANFLNNFVEKNIPKIFLEDYHFLENSYLDLNWPKKPKYIFSSYGYFYDEIFKIYASKLREENNTKIILSQHGGSYGMEENSFETFFETKIADRFLTWGWKNNKKHYPLFITSVENEKKIFKFNIKNKIILVLYQLSTSPIRPSLNTRVSSLDVNLIYTKLIINFIKNLNNNLKNKVEANIKLEKDLTNNSLVKNSILSRYPKLKFIQNNKLIHEIRNEYNLQVEFYLSTGFLEAMYLNNPVILIYNNLLRKQKKDVIAQIQLLKKKKYLFW